MGSDLMSDQERSKQFVKEALESGYIDYDDLSWVILYYKGYEIYKSVLVDHKTIYIQKNKRSVPEFKPVKCITLYNKLTAMLKAWEAI